MPTTSINDAGTQPPGVCFLTEEPKTGTDKHLPIFPPANTEITMSLTTLKGMFALSAVVTFLKCKTTANGDQETLAKELSRIPRLSLFAPSLCGYVQCSICVPTVCAARLTSLKPRGRILKFVTPCAERPRPPRP